MSFTPTSEQQAIVDFICKPIAPVLTVEAVAGSSKSSTSVLAAKTLKSINPSATIRYLVFGKLAADEAKLEFGTSAIVSNIHQLAYHHTIRTSTMYLLRTPFISWRDIPKHIHQPFKGTQPATELITAYCDSSYTDFTTFCLNTPLDTSHKIKTLANQIMGSMQTGEMGCTHSFYLKVFHMELLAGHIQLEPVDVLIMDECNDLTPITVDIAEYYPAKLKVFVGDSHQAINAFMGCINAFDLYPSAYKLTLSRSFRCSTAIATAVQSFGKHYMSPDFIFTGQSYPDNPTITTQAYITRTNSEIIDKMIQLNTTNTPYKLASTAKITQMFETPLALLRCKPGNTETNPKFKRMQQSVDEWSTSKSTISKTKWLLAEFPENPELKSSVALIAKYSPSIIIDCYNSVTSHIVADAPLQLLTAFTSKGITRDSVEISAGLNDSVLEHMQLFDDGIKLTPQQLSEIYLGYVSITRSRHEVLGCKFVPII